jgi:hypothetical protein
MNMAGPRVVVLYEDKTAGGLHHLVRSMVEVYRNEAGREPFAYFGSLPMKGNSKLIAECSSYERLRFFGPHRADYVMAVIDAYEVEKVVVEAPAAPLGDSKRTESVESFRLYCEELATAVREHMRTRALGRMTPDRRQAEESHFFPRVLFWERESIFLAGSAILRETRGLEFPADAVTEVGIMLTRCLTGILKNSWLRRPGCRQPYAKQIDGPRLFGDLVRRYTEWPQILGRLPSFHNIINTLVGI